MHGPRHRLCVRKLTKLASIIDCSERHAQIQLPVVCGDDQMPEPDFAVIFGADEDYAGRLPTSEEAARVIEVADSSYERDSEEKLQIYAAAEIAQYLIVNLRNDTVEQYTDPDSSSKTFRTKATFNRGEKFSLRLADSKTLEMDVADVLP